LLKEQDETRVIVKKARGTTIQAITLVCTRVSLTGATHSDRQSPPAALAPALALSAANEAIFFLFSSFLLFSSLSRNANAAVITGTPVPALVSIDLAQQLLSAGCRSMITTQYCVLQEGHWCRGPAEREGEGKGL